MSFASGVETSPFDESLCSRSASRQAPPMKGRPGPPKKAPPSLIRDRQGVTAGAVAAGLNAPREAPRGRRGRPTAGQERGRRQRDGHEAYARRRPHRPEYLPAPEPETGAMAGATGLRPKASAWLSRVAA